MTGRPESVAPDWADAAHDLSMAHRSTGELPVHQRCNNEDDSISGLPSYLARVNLGAAPGVASNQMVPKRTGNEDEVQLTASSTLQDVYLALSKGHKMTNAKACQIDAQAQDPVSCGVPQA